MKLSIISSLALATAGSSALSVAAKASVPPALEAFHERLSSLPSCPSPPRALEHEDHFCDMAAQNDPGDRLSRKMRHRSMAGYDAVHRIPEEKSWVCPADDGTAGEDEGDDGKEKSIVGHRIRWIVRNSSSGPISLAWLDPDRNNLEVSALNSKIVPPHADPDAVLYPNQWSTIYGFQGHVFHVRELKATTSGELVPGRILLRHRPGLIAIKNRKKAKFDCPPEALNDVDPESQNLSDELRAAFERTPENLNELCNVVHAGFVNRVGCPVDLYYAGQVPETDSGVPPVDIVGNYNATKGGPECAEQYKMHLGLNPSPRTYLDDWDSPVRYEGTYLNHRFVARLRHDPTVVTDDVIVARSVVSDCPEDKEKIGVGVGALGVGATIDVGLHEAGSALGHPATSSSPYAELYLKSNVTTTSLYKIANATRIETKGATTVPKHPHSVPSVSVEKAGIVAPPLRPPVATEVAVSQ